MRSVGLGTISDEQATPAADGGDQQPGDTPRRRRFGRRWLVVVAALVVLVIVAGAVAVNRFVFAYQPLERGSYSGWQGSRR